MKADRHMKHSVAVDAASDCGAFAQRKMSKCDAMLNAEGKSSGTPITRTGIPDPGCS